MTERGVTVAKAAYAAGFRGKSLVDITSLGLAESGGNPTAHNATPPDDSYGLWQINYYGNLAQSRTQKYGAPTTLFDPDRNAAAAYDLSGGGANLSPWQADFNNGSYYKYLPEATESVNAFLGGATAPGAVGTPGDTVMSPIVAVTPVSADTNKCLLPIPSVGPLGGGCLLHESNLRAILGGLILAGGVVVAGLGIILLVGARPATDLTAVIGKMSPSGTFAALSARRSRKDDDRDLAPTPEQQRQARQRYRDATVKDPNDF